MRVLLNCRDRELAERVQKAIPPEARFTWETDLDRLISRFEQDSFDVLIITAGATQSGKADGLELLEVISSQSPVTRIVFLADREDIGIAISALRIGSYQYARLPIGDEELRLLIQSAIATRPSFGTNHLLKDSDADSPDEIVGISPAMEELYKQIELAASTDIPVLVTGQTGTGKDLVAQAIHVRSGRSGQPFEAVNVGAIPRELVGSELFGHEKGAFTGAAGRRAGRFEAGDGGTVFLDEIGTVDEKVQVSLLRLIEQKQFHRLGGRQPIEVDIRLIAATNEDLATAVREGTFREDLLYRLDVFRIQVPALCDRAGDVRLLVEHFVHRYANRFEKDIQRIHPDFYRLLEQHSFPGNVRELKNIVQRAALVCEGEELLPDHLPPRLRGGSSSDEEPVIAIRLGASLEEAERTIVARTLRLCDNNRKRSAEILGISRGSLYNKLRKYGLD